jgi:hypothetical protein
MAHPFLRKAVRDARLHPRATVRGEAMNFRATLGLLLLSAAALAGISSTESPTVYMILLADNTVEKGKTAPKTEAECIARAQAIIPQGSCSIRRTFVNAGTCDAKPAWPREIDANGFVVKPGIRGKLKSGSDSEYDFEVEDYVPAPYPECWVKGWRVAELTDFDDEPELASVDEPVWHTPEQKAAYDAFNAMWNSPEAVAAREEFERTHPPVKFTDCSLSDDPNCGARG